MSEPTAPDSEPAAEPDVEPAAEPDAETPAEPDAETPAEPAAEPDVEIDPDTDVYAEPDADPVAPTGGEPPARSRQLIYIAAALVVALALGGGLFLAFRGGDDGPTKVSAQDQASAAAVALLDGTYKSAQGDSSGCRTMTDNLALTPEQSDFFDRCVTQTNAAEKPTTVLVVDSIKATKVTLDETAGTGKVTVDVTATVDGASKTQTADVPVKKVDGVWKVDPLG